jgi:hypothetical protein
VPTDTPKLPNAPRSSTHFEVRPLVNRHLLHTGSRDDDFLRLPDSTLIAAVSGVRPLTRNERHALLDSPVTRDRLRVLIAQNAAKSAAPAPLYAGVVASLRSQSRIAANDPEWHGSVGYLRAADAGEPISTLHTEDGVWQLHFEMQAAHWVLRLQLVDFSVGYAAALVASRQNIRVLDSNDAVLLSGQIDDYGELQAAWPLDTAPSDHFRGVASGFAVQPQAIAP